MDYALIENGVVANIIYLHPMNASDFPNAVSIGDYPVSIGDTYADGEFYRNGEALKTASELAREETNDMQAALNELGVSVDG